MIGSQKLVLIALCGLVMLTACSGTVTGTGSPTPVSATDASPASATSAVHATSAAASPVGDVTRAQKPPPATIPEGARAPIRLIDQGFTAYDVAYTGKVLTYAAKIHNPNPDSWVASAVTLKFTFKDAAGTVLFVDDLENGYTILPGADSAVAGTAEGNGGLDKLATSPTRMDVEITRTHWFSTDDVIPGSVAFGPATVRPVPKDAGDSVDGVIVSCEATSTFASKLGDAYVEIVYLDAAGKIIGGDADNSTLDNDFIVIPGTARTNLEMKELFSPPSGVPAAQCYGSFVTPT